MREGNERCAYVSCASWIWNIVRASSVEVLTTVRASLARRVLAEKARCWEVRHDGRTVRATVERNTGRSFDAMLVDGMTSKLIKVYKR